MTTNAFPLFAECSLVISRGPCDHVIALLDMPHLDEQRRAELHRITALGMILTSVPGAYVRRGEGHGGISSKGSTVAFPIQHRSLAVEAVQNYLSRFGYELRSKLC